MTRPLGHLAGNKLVVLLLVCVVVLGGTILFSRAHLRSAPHAAEMPGIGQLRELPPLW